jgi:phospholipase C
MYIVSPWTKGGWVNSQTFDHTSVIRFIETRFGVTEPNISAWRRAVCGDLTSAFNFKDPNDEEFFSTLPSTLELADQARALPNRTTPPTPLAISLPFQKAGVRPARALPYELHVMSRVRSQQYQGRDPVIDLTFTNTGKSAAVFHVYDRLNLDAIPRRYTVEPKKKLNDSWRSASTGLYDLWVLGPNGFHRHFTGNLMQAIAEGNANPDVVVSYDKREGELIIKLVNKGDSFCVFSIVANKYYKFQPKTYKVAGNDEFKLHLSISKSAFWYDFSVMIKGQSDFTRRFAGHLETGKPSISDPAMEGIAIVNQ